MKVKVCGIKTLENIQLINNLRPDMVGLNFYEPSVRYLHENSATTKAFNNLNRDILKVGVFVNADLETIIEKTDHYNLDYAQLHGDEDEAFCKKVKQVIPVIKVFRINESFNWNILNSFKFVDHFLFDTATKNYGGSGKKFNWTELLDREIEVPFLLSGGIGPDDAEVLKSISHPSFIGIDINSKFEIEKGVKSDRLLEKFMREISKQ